MSELCHLLNSTDPRTAIKWCEDKDLKVFLLCRKKVAYRFLVEVELDKILIQQLKKKYPNKWEDLYQCYQDNNRFEYLNLLEENIETAAINTIPQSKYAKEFMKKFN